jgi:hypothetical protein
MQDEVETSTVEELIVLVGCFSQWRNVRTAIRRGSQCLHRSLTATGIRQAHIASIHCSHLTHWLQTAYTTMSMAARLPSAQPPALLLLDSSSLSVGMTRFDRLRFSITSLPVSISL